VEDLNRVYRREPALHEIDFGQQGFEWVDFHNWEESIISFLRKGRSSNDVILVVCNFTPLRERITGSGFLVGVFGERS